MVLDKIKSMFNSTDEKYEVLYYKYSKLKLENQKLKEKHKNELIENKDKIQINISTHLIKLYQIIEQVKNGSFKIDPSDKEVQRLLIDINKAEKELKEIMKTYSIEELTASERFYDPELHDVASYETANGIQKGIILKTLKKGFKYRGTIIKKPKVIVTK